MKSAFWIPKGMFYRILWPSVISALALAAADIADALVVGSMVGEKGLAAIGIVTPVYMLYNLFGYGFSAGGCVTHGKLTALGKDGIALYHFKMLAGWLLLGSLAVAVLGNVLTVPFLSLLGVDSRRPELLALCEEYTRPLLAAAPVFMLNFLLYDFVRCDNAPGLASLGFSLGCIVDLGLNILLVVVLRLGIRGSIAATVTAQAVSVAVLMIHLLRCRGILRLKAILSARAEKAAVRKHALASLRIGFSSSMRYIFQFAFLFVANHLLLRAGNMGLINGDLYVAVLDVVMNVSFVALALYQAVSDTMQPLGAAFTQEKDTKSLRYVLKLALYWGLGAGAALSCLAAIFPGAVASFFGLNENAAQAIAVPAIRIFCLSTPFAGFLMIMTGFCQSSGKVKWSSLITALRTFVILLPVTLLFGYFSPNAFWWVFPVCEGLSCLIVLAARRFLAVEKIETIPTFSACMDHTNNQLEKVLTSLEEYCGTHAIPMKKAIQLQLAVEELCLVTMEQAFTGRPDEYIQITLAQELNGDYSLVIRNSAPRFNPFTMEMGRLQREEEEKLMASMGVLLVKEQSKALFYRNYQGFNVLMVIL